MHCIALLQDVCTFFPWARIFGNHDSCLYLHSLEAKCIQTPNKTNPGYTGDRSPFCTPLFTSVVHTHTLVQIQAIDQRSGANVFKMKKTEPHRCRGSPAKRSPASMSRLCSYHHSTRGKREERKNGRSRGKKQRDFKIGFAEGSNWNIHHSMPFFWDPTAVSGGAGVGEWKTRSLVTERWNSNTARREMARIQQRKPS